MGFKISWLAFQGLDRPRLLERLGMTDSGEPDEACEAPFCLSEGPTGWAILFVNDFGFGDEGQMRALSADARALVCRVHEGLMFSGAALYENGARKWGITHDAQKGLNDLRISGAPPETLDAIHERLTAPQNYEGGFDCCFDIPLELARSLTGYRHDVYAPEIWAFTKLHRSGPTSTKASGADLMGRLKGLFSRE